MVVMVEAVAAAVVVCVSVRIVCRCRGYVFRISARDALRTTALPVVQPVSVFANAESIPRICRTMTEPARAVSGQTREGHRPRLCNACTSV